MNVGGTSRGYSPPSSLQRGSCWYVWQHGLGQPPPLLRLPTLPPGHDAAFVATAASVVGRGVERGVVCAAVVVVVVVAAAADYPRLSTVPTRNLNTRSYISKLVIL